MGIKSGLGRPESDAHRVRARPRSGNIRRGASWLLVREFGRRFRGARGCGRIVALTSDAVIDNLPYSASKGALDRIVIAAATEFRDLGITANVVNPGPTEIRSRLSFLK